MSHFARLRSAIVGAALLSAVVLESGCTILRAGPGRAPTNFDYLGPGNAYATVNDLRKYDGDIFQLDLLDGYRQRGELINLDIWPIVGVGVGLFGVRVHFVSLGAGAGTLFYEPHSAGHPFDGDEVSVEAK